MQLCPGQAEEFRRRHDPLWPQLQATFEIEGVHNFSIHLHTETGRLFAYAEIESEENWAAIRRTEICQDWWASMRGIVEFSEGGPIEEDLEEVFYLP